MKDGGPAFPTTVDVGSVHTRRTEHVGGMSLRDYFAAKALAALIVAQPTEHDCSDAGDLACHAYRHADAMLAAREPKEKL